jgi:RNA polymerase sigma-70 factor (ECF subfamily)
VNLTIGRLTSPAREEAAVDQLRQSDEALVAAAQVDRVAFAPLYTCYVDSIFRFCYRRLGNRAAAEDATSRVFERALAALPGYQKGPFRAWLFTIARNVVIDLHRANRRDQPLDAAAEILDSRPGPEETSVHRSESAWIRGLLAHLTPDQQQIVELRLAGLVDHEIAQVLGRSHVSVRALQYRALQKLRILIDQKEGQHAAR